MQNRVRTGDKHAIFRNFGAFDGEDVLDSGYTMDHADQIRRIGTIKSAVLSDYHQE
jgi:hypothetical protein